MKYVEFARLLNTQLRDLDRSPTWLARRLQLHPATVTRWCAGETRPGNPELVVRIMDVLGFSSSVGRQALLYAAGYGYGDTLVRQIPLPHKDVLEEIALAFKTQAISIDLSSLGFLRLPSEIYRLHQLRFLNLEDNNLETLSPQLCQLTELIELNVSGNKLRRLPSQITKLTKLQKLDLRGNDKLPIPQEIVEQVDNPAAILAYWKEYSASERPLNEVKMILVGQPMAGKTSLVRRLIHDKYDTHQPPTDGIHIHRWWLSRTGQEIQVNIWDFGGQEIMHATHQFFITQRSLYLLVLNMRKGESEGRAEYWLAHIRNFAGDVLVLVVLNRIDEDPSEVNRKGLEEKYPNIIGFVRTSARTGTGVEELRQKIINALEEMPHIDTPFPSTWFEVKEQLETMQAERNYLPYEEYCQLCQREGVLEEISQRTLIKFLHDLGVALNFQDDDRVRDTNILNPEWVTQGVYRLIKADALQLAGGILRREQLGELLDAVVYPPEKRHFILQMMEKFELAYPFEGGNAYLIPDLLPVEEPDFFWEERGSLKFEYRYEVLPYSVLSRFIVRQHPRICRDVAWRTGVLLAYEGMEALIKADIEKKMIRIAIAGTGRRHEFLQSIRFTFDSLHEPFKLKPAEYVPIGTYSEASISYAHLLRLKAKRILEYLVENLETPINVPELLGTIETAAMSQQVGLTRQDIFHFLTDYFDLAELQELCFLLNLSYDGLPGSELRSKTRELILYAERVAIIPELITLIQKKRPHLFGGGKPQSPS